MDHSAAFEHRQGKRRRHAPRRQIPRTPDSPWFPGQWVSGVSRGWDLANGEHWDGADAHAVDLLSFAIHQPTTLTMSLRIDQQARRTLEFRGLSELKVEGDLSLGLTDGGWEVMGTDMVIAKHVRDDGRVVYMLELPTALICLASFPATESTTNG